MHFHNKSTKEVKKSLFFFNFDYFDIIMFVNQQNVITVNYHYI